MGDGASPTAPDLPAHISLATFSKAYSLAGWASTSALILAATDVHQAIDVSSMDALSLSLPSRFSLACLMLLPPHRHIEIGAHLQCLCKALQGVGVGLLWTKPSRTFYEALPCLPRCLQSCWVAVLPSWLRDLYIRAIAKPSMGEFGEFDASRHTGAAEDPQDAIAAMRDSGRSTIPFGRKAALSHAVWGGEGGPAVEPERAADRTNKKGGAGRSKAAASSKASTSAADSSTINILAATFATYITQDAKGTAAEGLLPFPFLNLLVGNLAGNHVGGGALSMRLMSVSPACSVHVSPTSSLCMASTDVLSHDARGVQVDEGASSIVTFKAADNSYTIPTSRATQFGRLKELMKNKFQMPGGPLTEGVPWCLTRWLVKQTSCPSH